MRNKIILSIISLLLLLLAACGKTSSEKMYEKLEQVVSIEKGFEEQQEPLVNLEKEEQEIYSKIITLGLDQMEEITALSNQALASIEKRNVLMNEEEESIKKSKEKFQTIRSNIEELDEEKDKVLKEKADALYDTMMERYEAHSGLYKHYIEGLSLDKRLYEMFKEENVDMEELEGQVEKINEAYEKVYQNNENFNELTKKYNELKMEFYKEAGIKTKKSE